MSLIGQRLMVHPTSVTNTIDRLEKQALVVRRPNPRDGRGTLAEITQAGREVVQRATADLMKAEFGMAGYSDAQLEELFAMLRSLRVTAGDFTEPLTGDAVQVRPPSLVTKISPRLASAGSATPWVALVMPT